MIPAVVGRNDLILADRFSHACTRDGARLSGANVMRFAHNRVEHCQELLKQHRAGFDRCLILTEIESFRQFAGAQIPLYALPRLMGADEEKWRAAPPLTGLCDVVKF